MEKNKQEKHYLQQQFVHNYRILVISTGYQEEKLDNCFWEKEKKVRKNLGLFGPNTNLALEEGVSRTSQNYEK